MLMKRAPEERKLSRMVLTEGAKHVPDAAPIIGDSLSADRIEQKGTIHVGIEAFGEKELS